MERVYNDVHYDRHLLYTLIGILTLIECAEIRRASINQEIDVRLAKMVVLDCDYDYDQNDMELSIRWYYANSTSPVYQWIPNIAKRHVSQKFNDLTQIYNYTYKSNDHPFKMYRALVFSTNSVFIFKYTGNYTCLITSRANEKRKEGYLLIYRSPEKFEFTSRVTNNLLLLECLCENIYPKGTLNIYSSQGMVEVNKSIERYDDFLYKIKSVIALNTSFIHNMSINWFKCKLTIPNTSYIRIKTISLQPETSEANGSNRLESNGALIIIIIYTIATAFFHNT